MNGASSKPRIIAIIGPTASGKTALGMTLAQEFGGEIVSADSRQIYRGMDIGTAKPTAGEQRAIPHHLIDIKDPSEDYTVAEYQRDAVRAIKDILNRGKLPILAGGTGLYLRAVLSNLAIPEATADPALRAKLEQEIAESGIAGVFGQLVALDPEAEYTVDARNPRRVIRALEVALATGEPFTAQRKKNEPLFDALALGIRTQNDALRERINARADQMVAHGLIEEVRGLIEKYGTGVPALDAIGYREIIQYLENKISLVRAVALIKTDTWHYAKRQMTWFKKEEGVRWITGQMEASGLAATFLDKNSGRP